MIVCQVCNKELKKITNQHLITHNMTLDQYKDQYPDSKLMCDETRQRYADSTSRHYNSLTEEQKKDKYAFRTYSTEQKDKMRSRLNANRHKIDYNDSNRTKAISESKKAWWANKTKEERSSFFKDIVVPKTIEHIGYDKFLEHRRIAGIKGYNTVIKKGTEKQSNYFESYMLSIVSSKGYEYVEQFEIDGWFYDCFIPSKNLIIEFDGSYWHAEKEEDCIDDRLKRQWKIDRYKESLAVKKGYEIIRVKEREKDTLKDII